MTESFRELFEKSLKKIKVRAGSIIQGKIIDVGKDIVTVDAGLKSESLIPIEQFKDSNGKINISVGDTVDVFLDSVENGFGETILSRDKAKQYESWIFLEKVYNEKIPIVGTVIGRVKGGFTIDLNNIKAFLPGSLVDVRPVRDNPNLDGKQLEFKIIKLDKQRNNIVVSRKAIIESENNVERKQLIKKLKEGANINGIVKNITDYGAFIDLGGIDGLLHITDIAWKRIKHPSEVINIGQEITVKILKFDEKKIRVSLGLKQLETDPWINLSNKYPNGTKLTGTVTNITDYGCFVDINNGVEGLVHISEMDWINKNIHPSKMVKIGEIVTVMVINIDEKRRRISLGLKQCKDNPWKKFNEKYPKGSKITGKVKAVTDFGIFIELNNSLDGLIHLSDISWSKINTKNITEYKKGTEITAIVLQVDIEKERISLGLKQLKDDPFIKYIASHDKNSIMTGRVIRRNKNNIIIELAKDVEGIINNVENHKHNENIEMVKTGDIIKVKTLNVDHKNRIINLTFINQQK